ncbi:cysteine hydrolase [Geodermatophilus sp. TF02-6]|nr:cysteine hydrolase [Geodermatophilus sp. TF02-6]
MQTAFAEPDSAWAAPGYDSVASRILGLVTRFPGRVVYTRFVPDPAEPGSWAGYYDRWSTMRLPPSSSAWDLTIPSGESPVVSLPTFSKWGPQLAATVGPDAPLVLCGVATDCCVLATALAAADSGRSVTVVRDACAGVSQRHHDEALSLLDLLAPMVTVVAAADIPGPQDADRRTVA